MSNTNQETMFSETLMQLQKITPYLDDDGLTDSENHARNKLIEICVHIANLYE